MALNIQLVSEQADLLGESPVWDPEAGCLYWVDGVSRLIRSHDPATGSFRQWEAPSIIGSVALGTDGTLVAGLVDGIYSMDVGTGAFTPLFRPQPVEPDVRFNDGKVDRFGRFLCGSMGIHAAPLGRLWRLDCAGNAEVCDTGIRISNSLCFSPDGSVMYFADSLERTIRAYPYGPGNKPVGTPAVLVDTSPWNSGPDGATVDADGCLWVCLVQAGRIARFTPQGELDHLIEAPTDLPSSVAFGGPDLSTLYVTSIRDSGSGRAVSRHPQGGCLFAIDGLGVRGLPEKRFGEAVNSSSMGAA